MKDSRTARKIVSLILCLLMLVPFLTACSEEIKKGSETAAKAQTITITMIKGDNMTDEAITAVENKINEITEKSYNTHVVLQMFTADEYTDKVMEMSDKLCINTENGMSTDYVSSMVILDPNVTYREEANGDYSYVDEQNRVITIYPTIVDTQLDIVLIDSVETYDKLFRGRNVEEESYLADLTEAFGAQGNVLGKMVNSTILDYAKKLNGSFRVIPNNYYYGAYSYIFVNKKYFDALGYDIGKITNFVDLKDYMFDLIDIKNKSEEYKEQLSVIPEDLIPLYNFPEPEWIKFAEGNDLLVLQPTTTAFSTTASTPPLNLFGMTYFQQSSSILYSLYKNGNSYSAENEIDFTKNFAVGFLNGDVNVPEKYNLDYDNDGEEDYYVVNYGKPVVDNSLFDSMYAISAFSRDVGRSFEILTLLQTNEEIVNLLAYGVEDIHYELDRSGTVVYKNSDYDMNYRYGGNTFLCYPNENMDEETMKFAADKWALAKENNKNLIISPYCGLNIRNASINEYEAFNKGYAEGEEDAKFFELPEKIGVQLLNPDGTLYEDPKSKKNKIHWYTDYIMRELEKYSDATLPKAYDFAAADAFAADPANGLENASSFEIYVAYLDSIIKEFRATELYRQLMSIQSSASIDTRSNTLSPVGQYETLFSKTY